MGDSGPESRWRLSTIYTLLGSMAVGSRGSVLPTVTRARSVASGTDARLDERQVVLFYEHSRG